MTEAEFMKILQDLWPGQLVRESTWLFVAGETAHFIGLCLMIGSLLVVDLRLLGFIRRVPYRTVLAFVPWAVVGFVLVAASGWAFLVSNPKMYWPNPAFKLKLIVIAIGGLNAALFTFIEHRHVAALGDDQSTGALTKATAFMSLVFWAVVIALGRLLPTFEGSRSFFG